MKIAIANDSVMATEALRRAVTRDDEHQVIWTARDGAETVELCARQRPELLLMDLRMPHLDGVETTRRVMRDSPCAILIVTATPDDSSNLVFRAMGAGALDVTATPVLMGQADPGAALLAKIRTIAKLVQADATTVRRASPAAPAPSVQECRIDTLTAIGASTGGPTAVARLLAGVRLPPNAAIVIVQHIDERFSDSFANWLSGQLGAAVTTVADGTRLERSGIYLAKSNNHLTLDRHQVLRYSAEPLEYPYRPSVDVFFHCVARHWPRQAMGVLLTGMGRDGAEGLLAMRRAAQRTIAQDRDSAVYGMPRAAAELQAAERILPLEKIGDALQVFLDTPH